MIFLIPAIAASPREYYKGVERQYMDGKRVRCVSFDYDTAPEALKELGDWNEVSEDEVENNQKDLLYST